MIKDLTAHVQAVFEARGVDAKKAALLKLIEDSHAKESTKRLMTMKASMLNNSNRLDKFAVDYAMSGEGMKVS